jgi:hypothetical protein
LSRCTELPSLAAGGLAAATERGECLCSVIVVTALGAVAGEAPAAACATTSARRRSIDTIREGGTMLARRGGERERRWIWAWERVASS